MNRDCEIRWCGQKDPDGLVYVNENIGDGSFRVGICHECARRLHLKPGDDLPEANEVRRLLKVDYE